MAYPISILFMLATSLSRFESRELLSIGYIQPDPRGPRAQRASRIGQRWDVFCDQRLCRGMLRDLSTLPDSIFNLATYKAK